MENENPESILDTINTAVPVQLQRDYESHLENIKDEFVKKCLNYNNCKGCEILTTSIADKVGIEKFISCYNSYLKKVFL